MHFNNIYQGKKVFISGHTGFKGSWLLSWLHLLGAKVKGYALAPKPEHKLFKYLNGETLCESTFHDILNYQELESNLLEFQPDYIFHLAAQPLVRYSYEHPLETFNVNVIGTANLLNTLRKLSKPCVTLVITTDKVYHNREWPYPYREEDQLGGFDPYSSSKACAEFVTSSFRASYFNRSNLKVHNKSIVTTRAGNVIGGGDWAMDRIVPDLIRAFENHEEVILRNPFAIRPWQHILEPLHAYLLLGQKVTEDPDKYHTEYNFGPYPYDSLTVEQMVKHAIKIWHGGSYKIVNSDKNPHEAGLLKLDISRANSDLGWRPVYTSLEAITKTISWYQQFDLNNAYKLIEENIFEFIEQYEQMTRFDNNIQ
ncbi:MAG: CDP-glucose 4,6-dehydratase [Saprospiraceae bacterium]|nr:CDP-glucose 4,6-dehydratase [Saprospiraceae bacterium]